MRPPAPDLVKTRAAPTSPGVPEHMSVCLRGGAGKALVRECPVGMWNLCYQRWTRHNCCWTFWSDRLLPLDCKWDGGLGAAAQGQWLRFRLSVLTATPAGSFCKCLLNMEPGMITPPHTCQGHAAGPQGTPRGEEWASPGINENRPSTIPCSTTRRASNKGFWYLAPHCEPARVTNRVGT